MCFNKNEQLHGGNAWVTQVATDDIIVYKYLIKKKLLFFNKYYAPVISRFSYKKGKTYYSPLKIAIHYHEKIKNRLKYYGSTEIRSSKHLK